MSNIKRFSHEVPDKTTPSTPLQPLHRLILLWTLLIISFAVWDGYQLHQSQLNTAVAVARDSYNKDMVYRSWAAMHGGVYVPITERTPSNPYLSHIQERDIRTPSGRQLTLMNPTYMIRQIHEIGREQYDIRAHITSLNPIRPENAADQWETRALKDFQNDASESMSKQMIDGKPYIRFMKPLMVEEECLDCHASQGYKNGEIRGGISTSLPWTPYQDRIIGTIPEKATIFGIVWILGIVSTVIGRRKLLQYLDERNRAEEEKLALEQRLQQSQKLESLGVLAGGIAHDFNNILGTIIGHCGILQLRPEKIVDSVPEIEKAAERAALLCRQMLAYAGRTQTVISRFDMTLLVAETVRSLKAIIPHNVVINTDFSAVLPPVKGDSEQLRQIVINLITNAAEAIGNTPGEIHLSLAKEEIMTEQTVNDYLGKPIAAGSYACLEVTDNGCGMNGETRSKIFEPFFTTNFFGRGMGMSALLGIITVHKGAVQLSSRLGEGTTIKLYLPLQDKEDTARNLSDLE